MAKDNFSAQAATYAAYRPRFPEELYAFITSQINGRDLAWDVATGNGQAAEQLAPFFTKVLATDISESQLAHAIQLPNIEYKIETAEQPSLPDHSVDLINISQALHWFQFDAFYPAVQRVAKPGAIIAAYSYSMFHSDHVAADELIHDFYAASAPYWDAERKYIDEAYRTIPFPFKEITSPGFSIEYEWNANQVLGYFEAGVPLRNITGYTATVW